MVLGGRFVTLALFGVVVLGGEGGGCDARVVPQQELLLRGALSHDLKRRRRHSPKNKM